MKLKLCKLVRSCLDVLATATAVAAMLVGGAWYWPLLIAAIVLLLAGVVLCAVRYRCPSCGAALPVRGKTPKTCPSCGSPLQS